MSNTRKILVISPFESWPLSQGSIVRTHYFVQYLSQHHDVSFAFRGGPQQADMPALQRQIRNTPNRLRQLFDPRFFMRLWQTVRQEEIDLIVVSQIWSGVHGLLLKLLTGKRLLFDNHNVEYLRFRRMGSPAWPVVALLEFLLCHIANQVICVSETDKRYLAQRLRVPKDKMLAVSNGAAVKKLFNHPVDVRAIKEEIGLQPDEAMILFFGSLTHRPNAQAVDVILQELVPRLQKKQKKKITNAKIVIVGLGHSEYVQTLKQPVPANVIFAGFVHDITAVIKSADVVIVPLTAGSGTRFKIIESVACGRRVVSTSVGAEGLEHSVFGESLVIRDDWNDFVEQIGTSLAKPPALELTAEFVATYDWQYIWGKICLDHL